MRFLISPQEFKGSLSAQEAAHAIARGLRRVWPEAELDVAPMADGGPGTVAAVLSARGGRPQKTVVSDPLGRPVEAAWALLDDGPAAVIEMAAASGLVLLRPEELDPRRTTTRGTGELIRTALDAGCRRLTVGVGGSATNDGGAGMAQALGARLLDERGRDLPPGGAALARLSHIDVSGLDARLADVRAQVATDVTSPLCGDLGASRVYGPQKGATPEVVEELEAALCRYAEIVRRDLGVDIVNMPGAGAAGGLGGGLVAFLKAEVRPGGEFVAEAIGLRERMRRADVVLTGEGRLDRQTGFGKTVATVARMAKEEGRPVIALVGGVEPEAVARPGIDAVLSIVSRPMTLAEAIAEAAELLEAAAARAAALVRSGSLPRR